MKYIIPIIFFSPIWVIFLIIVFFGVRNWYKQCKCNHDYRYHWGGELYMRQYFTCTKCNKEVNDKDNWEQFRKIHLEYFKK